MQLTWEYAQVAVLLPFSCAGACSSLAGGLRLGKCMQKRLCRVGKICPQQNLPVMKARIPKKMTATFPRFMQPLVHTCSQVMLGRERDRWAWVNSGCGQKKLSR